MAHLLNRIFPKEKIIYFSNFVETYHESNFLCKCSRNLLGKVFLENTSTQKSDHLETVHYLHYH